MTLLVGHFLLTSLPVFSCVPPRIAKAAALLEEGASEEEALTILTTYSLLPTTLGKFISVCSSLARMLVRSWCIYCVRL